MPRKRAKGHSPNARKVFGKPPRGCPKCGNDGFVMNTRVTKDSITRRRECFKGHRWTTVEMIADGSRSGIKSTDLFTRDLRRQMIDGLISELKVMRR